MYDSHDNSGTFEKLRDIAERVISLRNFSLISEINPELSKNLDRLLHELAVSQTELLKQNQCLQDARDKYYELYENAPIGYLSLNPNGIITEANSTIAGFLNFSKNDLLENPFARFVTYEDRPLFYAKFGRLQNDMPSIECSLSLFSRNAVHVFVEIFCKSMKNKSGRIEGYSMSVINNHRAEKNDAFSEKHSSADNLYMDMFRKNISPGLLLDADSGAILNANPAACRFYGYCIDEILKMNIRDLNPSMDGTQWHEYVHRTFAMKKELLNSSIIIATGKNMDVEIHSTPLVLENKRIIFCIIHDVTEQKELEKQLFDYLSKMRKLNEDLTKYAIGLARNVRTPVFAVHKYANLLIKKVKESITARIPNSRKPKI